MKHQALRPFGLVIALLCLAVMGGCGNITSDTGNAATATVPATTRVVPTPSPTQSNRPTIPDLTTVGLKKIALSDAEAKQQYMGNPIEVKLYASSKDVTTTTSLVQEALSKAGFVRFKVSVNVFDIFYSCIQKDTSYDLNYVIAKKEALHPYGRYTVPPNTPTAFEKIYEQLNGYTTEVVLAIVPTTDCKQPDSASDTTSIPITIPITVITATPERVPDTVHP